MYLWKKVSDVLVTRFLRFAADAKLLVNNVIVSAADLAALSGLSAVLTNLAGLTATAAQVDRVAVPASGVETVAATNVIAASESGKTFFLSHATEFASTLPAPAAGLKFSFIVAAAPSSADYTITSTTDLIHGVAVSSADAGGSVDSTAGTPVATIAFVDGQAKVGDRVDLISDGTSWFAIGFCSDEDAITFTAA